MAADFVEEIDSGPKTSAGHSEGNAEHNTNGERRRTQEVISVGVNENPLKQRLEPLS